MQLVARAQDRHPGQHTIFISRLRFAGAGVSPGFVGVAVLGIAVVGTEVSVPAQTKTEWRFLLYSFAVANSVQISLHTHSRTNTHMQVHARTYTRACARRHTTLTFVAMHAPIH